MKLLIINPNISASVSDLILAEATRSAAPGTELLMRTAGFGVEYIETRAESLIAGGAVLEIMACEQHLVDGVVVAAFGDPGMPALKEVAGIPVVGITEAAFHTAALLGGRFSIIAISNRITAWYRECVERNGMLGRLASIRSLNDSLPDIGTVQQDFATELLRLAREVVEQDGADVVILAGAPLAGLARSIGDQIPVPVVDGISAGIKQCELLVSLAPGTQQAGSFARPPAKANAGLSPAVAGLLGTVVPAS